MMVAAGEVGTPASSSSPGATIPARLADPVSQPLAVVVGDGGNGDRLGRGGGRDLQFSYVKIRPIGVSRVSTDCTRSIWMVRSCFSS